ncbi:hypothetical protein [Ornithinimicrobium avium]|uniref:Uncharacterized protein n=1 Tax=Ornithinimicrobium avium TaxID=2283195 RepID=A0A345NMV5_9MICO|nr:hypothetical protein [Ornithinimicrobium avium]AXH96363.1 hypothetical protein DV701_09745 [Ornithinimicrobium avium]
MTTTTPRAVPEQDDAVEHDRTVRFRRYAAALALPVAFLFQLVCNSLYAWASTTSGLTDSGSAADALALYGAFPGTLIAAVVLATVGSMLALLGLPAALRVFRPSRPKLALWAVGLMMTGYLCYFGISFTGFDTVALAVGKVDAAAALDGSPASAWSIPFFVLFVIGNLLGTLLLGLTAFLAARSQETGVPWWAGALIACWTVGHVINIVVTNEWFAVAGGALEIVGLLYVAAAALRLSNRQWVERG